MAILHLDPLPRNATPGDILRFLCDTAGLDGKQVGRIAFVPRGATAEVPDSHAAKVLAAVDGATFRERRVRARYATPPTRKDKKPDHFDHLIRLLDKEATEERRRLKEQASGRSADDPFGAFLSSLVVREQDIGLGGRLLLTFTRKVPSDALPPNRLGPGSPVVLTQTGVQRPASYRGVMVERAERSVTVALPEPEDDLPDDAVWRLDLSPDEASRQRQVAAMLRAQAAEKDRLAELRAVLLGEEKPKFAGGSDTVGQAYQPDSSDANAKSQAGKPDLHKSLNAPQEAAVAFALTSKDVAVVHGPPGTGKTTTVVELIRRAVARGERVLASASSNAAVDNLLDKLLTIGEEPVRLGHPARVSPLLRDRTLDELVERHPDARQARKAVREAFALFRKADKWTRAKPQPGEKQALRQEARDLLADARRLEEQAVDRVLDDAKIICSTLTSLDSETLGRRRYELAVLDEACQSTEPASWIPLLRCDRVVFAGDPCQLPPTILSAEATAGGLAVSLMERVMRLYPGSARLLTVQYRMHAHIMGFSSAEFYGGKLIADPSVIGHRLCDLPGVASEPWTETPARFIDTAGAGYDEEAEADTSSRLNPQEAELAATQVRKLLAAGLAANGIAVITPYSGQVRRLRELLKDTGVEIDSVDGFQGREKEAVVISLVRSNPEGQIGFLSDTRRTNVALTRARRSLTVIGDSATLAGHPFYANLISYFETIGGYGTVWEEM